MNCEREVNIVLLHSTGSITVTERGRRETCVPQFAPPAILALFDNIYTRERQKTIYRLMHKASTREQRNISMSLVYTCLHLLEALQKWVSYI